MRLPALIAIAALVGLSACDSAKVSELTGARPAKTQIAAACPPAVAPACPPATPVMAPEAARPEAARLAAVAAPVAAARPAAHRVQPHAKARAWAQRQPARHARPHHPPVRRFAYAGGYTGEAPQGEPRVERHHEHHYARPDEPRGQHAYRDEHREDGYAQDGYAQDGYRYERRESGHAPYVDERRDEGVYRYERREGSMERSGSSSSYEHSESGYSSGGSVSGGGYADDCNCRPQAAGRDGQGFLTWPGKR